MGRIRGRPRPAELEVINCPVCLLDAYISALLPSPPPPTQLQADVVTMARELQKVLDGAGAGAGRQGAAAADLGNASQNNGHAGDKPEHQPMLIVIAEQRLVSMPTEAAVERDVEDADTEAVVNVQGTEEDAGPAGPDVATAGMATRPRRKTSAPKWFGEWTQ